MSTYFYSLITLPSKVPSEEKKVGIDAGTDADAIGWITSNDTNYVGGSTAIYLRQLYNTEAAARGFSTLDGVGASGDAAATVGSAGSLSAKARLMTTQLDSLVAASGLPSSVGDQKRLVTTAATAVQLSTSSVPCKKVIITALDSNTGTIVVGASSVIALLSNRRGLPLDKGDSVDIAISNLNLLYLDATVSGEGVSYIYLN